ncbi:MAG: hypothetical protein AB1589_18635 [Cyanobacteriota bacterium]
MPQKIITPAFNYDQQTVPASPTSGQVWRERSTDNNVVEGWSWNGTYWLSNTKYVTSDVTTSSGLSASRSGFPTPYVGSQLNSGVFILYHVVSGAAATSPQDINNYWNIRFAAGATPISSIFTDEIPNAWLVGSESFSKAVNLAIIGSSFSFDAFWVKSGTPGNLGRASQSLIYSLIR